MLDIYLKELRQRRGDWNAEVMKSYQARYLTFQTKNCPRDTFIPACVLADYGFYFDEIFRKVKCFECHYTYESTGCAPVDITKSAEDQCTLKDLLIDHIRSNKTCSQATKSLSDYLKDAFDSHAHLDIDASFAQMELKNLSSNMTDLHTRLRTFDDIRMLLSKQELAVNGFYRSVSKTKQINNVLLNALENETVTIKETIIEYLAKRLTGLIHLKCAFCPYECLVFENSALNTMYKSPFEEHKTKFGHLCSIFQNQNKQKPIHPSSDLNWLQSLYEMTSNGDQKIDAMIIKANQNLTEVKELPDVVKCLIDFDKYHQFNQKRQLSNREDLLASEKIIYVPNLNSTNQSNGASIANKTTNDFEKLKSVLSMSNTVINEEAFHKDFTHYQRRLDSFKEWPPSLPQQPDDLARAGFYYYGIKDMVKCFFCNGGLKNWDRNDDPFEDHVRWFPKCQYIRQLMGSEYVDKIKDKYKNQDSGFTNQTKQNQYSSVEFNAASRPSKTLVKAKRSASPRSVNSRLDLNIIRKITEITSISRDVLKQTIENKLSNESGIIGDDFFASSIELALAAYELNELNKEMQNDSNKHISDFVITNLPIKLNAYILNEFLFIRYGIHAKHIRILKEEKSETSCIGFVCLKNEDLSFIDEIYEDLNQKLFPIQFDEQNEAHSENLSSIIKTNWDELKENLKEFSEQTRSNELNYEQMETSKSEIQTLKEPNRVKEQQMNGTQNVPTSKKISKQESEEKNESYCIICLDNKKNIVFLPCAHFVSCMECGLSMKNCPVCRTKIQATVRTFS